MDAGGEGHAECGSGWPNAGPGSARVVCGDSRTGRVVTEAAVESDLVGLAHLCYEVGFLFWEVRAAENVNGEDQMELEKADGRGRPALH